MVSEINKFIVDEKGKSSFLHKLDVSNIAFNALFVSAGDLS